MVVLLDAFSGNERSKRSAIPLVHPIGVMLGLGRGNATHHVKTAFVRERYGGRDVIGRAKRSGRTQIENVIILLALAFQKFNRVAKHRTVGRVVPAKFRGPQKRNIRAAGARNLGDFGIIG